MMKLGEFIRNLQGMQKEIGPDGHAPHAEMSGSLEFVDQDGNELQYVEMEPMRMMGCGCWYGLTITLKRVAPEVDQAADLLPHDVVKT